MGRLVCLILSQVVSLQGFSLQSFGFTVISLGFISLTFFIGFSLQGSLSRVLSQEFSTQVSFSFSRVPSGLFWLFYPWLSFYDNLSRVPSLVFMLALFLIVNLAMFLQFRRKVHSKCRKCGTKKRMLLSCWKLWQKLSKQIPT